SIVSLCEEAQKRQGAKPISMEEEVRMAETEQGAAMSNEAQSSGHISNNSPAKRGRGRPQGSKKLKGSGDDHANNSVQTHNHTHKKRGRPKKPLIKSSPEQAAAEDLPNGGSDTPKMGRGHPKGSVKRNSLVQSRKRGRPKGSLNKKPRLEKEVSSEGEVETDVSLSSLKRVRGRPRKVEVNSTGESTQDTPNGILHTPRRGRGSLKCGKRSQSSRGPNTFARHCIKSAKRQWGLTLI
uniref:Uncharacterized protein n=1 Tax=Monopterus albus TaxID=43700 RepID=A0A3Q3KFI4_MONAL